MSFRLAEVVHCDGHCLTTSSCSNMSESTIACSAGALITSTADSSNCACMYEVCFTAQCVLHCSVAVNLANLLIQLMNAQHTCPVDAIHDAMQC